MVFRTATLLILTAVALPATAHKKGDRKMEKQLQTDITYLASDSLEGRRTGTDGERKAADYIESRYKKLNING